MPMPWLLLTLRVLMAAALIAVAALVVRYLVIEARQGEPAATLPPVLKISARFKTLERAFVLSAETWIGRDPNCLICFNDTYISARHAKIFWDDAHAQWRIEDAGSRNGTLVNDAQVTHAQLNSGDVISIGNITLIVM